jgi:alpha-N-acetylglucosamine transferase
MVDTTLIHSVTPNFKLKLNAHSMCAQESSLHTYRTENGYRITNVTIYNIFTE